MNVFLDTEFTDLIKDTTLISLGMVTDRGEEFYMEVPYPEAQCSPFVREAVLPLLGREPHAFCPLEEVYVRMMKWLNIVRREDEEFDICIDYEADWEFFCDCLDHRVPYWCHRKMIWRDINELLLYDFHKRTGLPEHHALYDARANQYAYRPRRPEG